MTTAFENKVKILTEVMSDTSPLFENVRYMLDVPPQTQADYEHYWELFIGAGQLVDIAFTSLSEIAEVWPMRLGPNHPKVIEAAAAFESWRASYDPLAVLDEAPLSALPDDVDPQTVWTVIDGLNGENMTAGFLSAAGNSSEVVGYVFCAHPFAPNDAGAEVFTELRQYCEQDEDDKPDGPCEGCTEELDFCNGQREQRCEIPNQRALVGASVSTLGEALKLVRAVTRTPHVAQVVVGSDSESEASAGRWPQGWGQYVELLKARETPIPRGFAVWAARFRAARAFSGVSFEGLSQQAVDGYFVGLKLTLAESALETYEKAMGLRVGSLGFTSPDLSFELWDERSQDIEKALKSLDNPRLQREFQRFLLSDKDTCQDFDLRVLLRAFRHLTAHGFFNPSSAGVYTSKTYRALLLGLADLALDICEREFVSEVVRPLS
jgi:hypothetical protein